MTNLSQYRMTSDIIGFGRCRLSWHDRDDAKIVLADHASHMTVAIRVRRVSPRVWMGTFTIVLKKQSSSLPEPFTHTVTSSSRRKARSAIYMRARSQIQMISDTQEPRVS